MDNGKTDQPKKRVRVLMLTCLSWMLLRVPPVLLELLVSPDQEEDLDPRAPRVLLVLEAFL